jgi:acyl-CoA thioesterase-1
LDCKPDVVMLMVGTNDVVWRQRWLTTAEYTVFLNTCCNLLKENGCRVILITIPPCVEEHVARREKCTPEETRQLMPRIDAINRAIVKVAKEYNYPVADFNALFTTDIRSRESLLRNVANGGGRDGVHPTVEGYRRLAVMLKQIMDLHKMPDTRIACVGDSITYGVHVEGAGTNTGATYPAQLLKLLNEQDKQQ